MNERISLPHISSQNEIPLSQLTVLKLTLYSAENSQTEQHSPDITICDVCQQVACSNLGQDIDYSDTVLSYYSFVPSEKNIFNSFNSLNQATAINIHCYQIIHVIELHFIAKRQGQAIPLQAWADSQRSRRLRFSEVLENRHMKVVRLSAKTPADFTPIRYPGTFCCQRLGRHQGHNAAGRIKPMKNPTRNISYRIQGLFTRMRPNICC